MLLEHKYDIMSFVWNTKFPSMIILQYFLSYWYYVVLYLTSDYKLSDFSKMLKIRLNTDLGKEIQGSSRVY